MATLNDEQVVTDVFVIGAGYAGVAAATTLARALHSVVVFDDDKPVNQWNTAIHHIPTWEGLPAEKTREDSQAELYKSEFIKVNKSAAEHVEKTDKGCFLITDAAGKKWLGRKILMASGVEHVFPKVDGYADNFATSIFPCMFQFGFEQRGAKSAGLLALDIISIPFFARMLSDDGHKFVDNFTIYTNGSPDLAKDLLTTCPAYGVQVDDRKIKQLRSTGNGSEIAVEFEDGTSKVEAFLVHRPDAKMNCPLIKQLNLKVSEHGNIDVAMPFCTTSEPGVYAAGDCASPMKIIPNAIAMGTYAGCGVARELPKRVTQIPPQKTAVNGSA